MVQSWGAIVLLIILAIKRAKEKEEAGEVTLSLPRGLVSLAEIALPADPAVSLQGGLAANQNPPTDEALQHSAPHQTSLASALRPT